MRKICFSILLVPALAWAQPQTAGDWYKEGENQYVLGNFDKAVEAFKQGFTLETDETKKPAYLYNVAQAYRQANDCGHALFFYKRFIALSDAPGGKPVTAKRRKEVTDWINELEVCVQQAATVGKKPPTTNMPPDGEAGDKNPPPGGAAGRKDTHDDAHKQVAAPGNTPSSSDDDDRGDVAEAKLIPGRPHVISARLTGGGTKISAGMFKVPVQGAVALIAGYPIAINDKLMVEAGAAFTATLVPYDTQPRPSMPARSETARLIGAMANGSATYEVMPQLGVRADLGIGALFFSNVSASQFTNFAATDGALSMFHVRAAVSADYAFTPNIIGTVTPLAFTYSPAKKGLEMSIKTITSIDFMVGIGYRM